jgi:hypothetical protein
LTNTEYGNVVAGGLSFDSKIMDFPWITFGIGVWSNAFYQS